VEKARLETSCEEPIGPGLVADEFEMVDGERRNGGLLCPIAPPPPKPALRAAQAAALHRSDGQQEPGMILYSLADRRYVRITNRGKWPTWPSDSRHLLYRNGGALFLLDTVSKASRQVLTIPPVRITTIFP
jgi:hypothetical protein